MHIMRTVASWFILHGFQVCNNVRVEHTPPTVYPTCSMTLAEPWPACHMLSNTDYTQTHNQP
jgi:hypothetical protein